MSQVEVKEGSRHVQASATIEENAMLVQDQGGSEGGKVDGGDEDFYDFQGVSTSHCR